MKKFLILFLLCESIYGVMIRYSLDTNNASTTAVVIDTQAKLMWHDVHLYTAASTNSKTWSEAITQCEDLEVSTTTDWRLPNINELVTIIDPLTSDPAINETFVNTASEKYWSSTTTSGYNATYAYGVDFNTSQIHGQLDKSNSYQVRCVRDF